MQSKSPPWRPYSYPFYSVASCGSHRPHWSILHKVPSCRPGESCSSPKPLTGPWAADLAISTLPVCHKITCSSVELVARVSDMRTYGVHESHPVPTLPAECPEPCCPLRLWSPLTPPSPVALISHTGLWLPEPPSLHTLSSCLLITVASSPAVPPCHPQVRM